MRPHVEIERSSQTCGRCSGTGCGKCGGTGEEAAPPTVVSITCICGNEIDGAKWDAMAPSVNCPQCNEDLSEGVAAAMGPLDEDGEPWDRADIDLEPWGLP